MCTALTYKTRDFYFGRTLDYDFSYGEEVVITPRNFPFVFRHLPEEQTHYAMIGMAHVAEAGMSDDSSSGNSDSEYFPLYYDGANEKGLAMAGLNFPGNAVYGRVEKGKDNVAQFELIPWILGKCGNIDEAVRLLEKINITDTPFSELLPTTPLHWLIADGDRAVTVEATEEGLRIYDNEPGVLTNNPPFDKQLFALNNYMYLSPENPKNRFSDDISLKTYCQGMGAMGLPGDWSSQSRFVRAAFAKLNAVSGDSEEESVGQFFHIMDTVAQPRGCNDTGAEKFEISIYTSCCNVDKGIYYYTTYENRQITAVKMKPELMEGSALTRYALVQKQQIKAEN